MAFQGFSENMSGSSKCCKHIAQVRAKADPSHTALILAAEQLRCQNKSRQAPGIKLAGPQSQGTALPHSMGCGVALALAKEERGEERGQTCISESGGALLAHSVKRRSPVSMSHMETSLLPWTAAGRHGQGEKVSRLPVCCGGAGTGTPSPCSLPGVSGSVAMCVFCWLCRSAEASLRCLTEELR